jgi:hypothetical protein
VELHLHETRNVSLFPYISPFKYQIDLIIVLRDLWCINEGASKVIKTPVRASEMSLCRKFVKRAYFSWNSRLSACCINDLIINQSSHAYPPIVNIISVDHDSCDATVVIAAAFAEDLIIIKLPRIFGDSVFLKPLKMSADRISRGIIIVEEK